MDKKLIGQILILVAVFLFFLLPANDTDLGWHLRYGQQIWQTGRIYKDNQIGFFLPDYEWINTSTGFGWLVYGIYKYFGLVGLKILSGLIFAGIACLFLKISRLNFVPNLLLLVYFGLTAWSGARMGIRAQEFSWLFVAMLIYILTKKKFVYTPLLFLVWVNMHGAFVLGLVIMGVYGMGVLKLIQHDRQDFKRLIFFGVLSFLVTFINPFGAGVYQETWRHAWYPLNQLIAEWVPVAGIGVFFVLVGVVMVAVKVLIIKKVNWLFWVWVMFLVLSCQARRNLPLFGLVTIFFISNGIVEKTKNNIGELVVGMLLIVLSLIRPILKVDVPMGGVEFLKNNPDKCKNIYNTYEQGGYLIWELQNRKFFVDGRMPAWPTAEDKSPYTIYLEIIQARPGWSGRVKSYGADCLFINKGTFLGLELEKGGEDWQKIYEGKDEVIYEKID